MNEDNIPLLCQACGEIAPPGTATCPNDGEASWHPVASAAEALTRCAPGALERFEERCGRPPAPAALTRSSVEEMLDERCREEWDRLRRDVPANGLTDVVNARAELQVVRDLLETAAPMTDDAVDFLHDRAAYVEAWLTERVESDRLAAEASLNAAAEENEAARPPIVVEVVAPDAPAPSATDAETRPDHPTPADAGPEPQLQVVSVEQSEPRRRTGKQRGSKK